MMIKTIRPAVIAALFAAPAFAMTALDANGDGLVTFEEFLAAVPTVTEESFIAIDANGDGAIDAEEYAAAEQAGTLPVASGG